MSNIIILDTSINRTIFDKLQVEYSISSIKIDNSNIINVLELIYSPTLAEGIFVGTTEDAEPLSDILKSCESKEINDNCPKINIHDLKNDIRLLYIEAFVNYLKEKGIHNIPVIKDPKMIDKLLPTVHGTKTVNIISYIDRTDYCCLCRIDIPYPTKLDINGVIDGDLIIQDEAFVAEYMNNGKERLIRTLDKNGKERIFYAEILECFGGFEIFSSFNGYDEAELDVVSQGFITDSIPYMKHNLTYTKNKVINNFIPCILVKINDNIRTGKQTDLTLSIKLKNTDFITKTKLMDKLRIRCLENAIRLSYISLTNVDIYFSEE